MGEYSNEYDVSQRIRTTDPVDVNEEVDRIFLDLYPDESAAILDRAFFDLARLYRGEYPGFLVCDTAYHDLQHVLDVTLAMARLVHGYERSSAGAEPLGKDLFQIGVITALFHDSGYIRHANSEEADRSGAEFTLTHVSRGARFLKDYLPTIGLPQFAGVVADLVHFTGYERPVTSIQMPSLATRLLGYLLGSADIMAQMADRCYLEKCRDRLYPEFLAGGIAKKKLPNGEEQVVFSSAEDLVMKTPVFYEGASHRLNNDLQGSHVYAGHYFGGQNLYINEMDKNIRFVKAISREHGASALRRSPPQALKKAA